MALKELQKQVDDWVQQYKISYWQPLSILARLTEETGELARELNDRYGGRIKKSTDQKKEIGDELGDILFTIICLANSQNIDLDKHWRATIEKSYKRDKDRYEKK
jgi:NTP pyrophosphatase (non-canonical NTP hydrolase)